MNFFEATKKTQSEDQHFVEHHVVQEQEKALRDGDDDLLAEASSSLRGGDSENVSPRNIIQEAMSSEESTPFKFIPLTMGGGGRTHVVSEGSKKLLDEVTLEDLQKMTDLFYEKAFEDKILDQFIRSHNDPHGARFAKWIHQKLSGSKVWDQDRRTRDLRPVKLAGSFRHVVHDRSSAHAAAWYSPKRPSADIGRHFTLDECRVWMRLHFWAMRESGMMKKSPSFCDYYVRFIGHFVRVYETTAQQFARDSLRWSEEPSRIQEYMANDRVMKDVLGLSYDEALAQIPLSESRDPIWPYNEKA